MGIPHFVYQFYQWTLELFLHLAIIHNVAMNIHIQAFVECMFSFLLSVYLKVELLGCMITKFKFFFS